MASSAPFKFKKEPTVVDQDTATEVIKRKFKPKAKPVKFTWQGARNFLTTLTGPTTMKLDRIRDLTERNVKAEEKDYIDFFEDLGSTTCNSSSICCIVFLTSDGSGRVSSSVTPRCIFLKSDLSFFR